MIKVVEPNVRVIASTRMETEVVPGTDWEHQWVTEPQMESQPETSDGGHVIVYCGRKCYKSARRPNPATADDRDYIERTLFEQGHFSIAEHVHITLEVGGFDRAFTHEHIRHRHFNYSQESQRFVNMEDLRIALHPSIRNDSNLREQTLRAVQDVVRDYRTQVADLTEKGLTRKQAREAARSLIPNCAEAPIVITGNVRSWIEMIERRIQPDADAQIQEYARLALEALTPIVPEVFVPFRNHLIEQGIEGLDDH